MQLESTLEAQHGPHHQHPLNLVDEEAAWQFAAGASVALLSATGIQRLQLVLLRMWW